MDQETFTFAAPVEPDRLASLAALLERIRRQLAAEDAAPGATPLLALGALGTIHFARFVLLEPDAKGRGPLLVFGTDFDGPREAHLRALAERIGDGLERVLQHCVGFQPGGGPTGLLHYLREHEIEALCTYRGHPGRSVAQIRAERELRDALAGYLDAQPMDPALDPQRACFEHVSRDDRFRELRDPPPPTRLRRREKLRLTLRWIGRNGGRLVRVLARIERRLRPMEDEEAAAFHAARASASQGADTALHAARRPLLDDEDVGNNNQLTSVTELKPDPLRREILELVLSLAHLRARTKFDQGDLSGIRTIHFARWFLLEEPPGSPLPPRLVFFSNYGGSWESYLGDFVDQAGWKLTAIWSHTQGFPPTEDLAWRGAAQERWFKEFVRRNQVSTQVWYAAYPELSVSEINRNSRLRELLPRQGGLVEREAWLQCL